MKPVVIVGAGPIGLATAIALRLRDIPCVVLDKRQPPFDKACGEGIMPTGVRHLTALGVRLSQFAVFEGIRYHDGPHQAEARFASPALGVRRTVLADGLLQRAGELGALLAFDTTVTGLAQGRHGARLATSKGELDARLVIGADGLHSRVRELSAIAATTSPNLRFAARRHYRVEPWSSLVDVHWDDHCEAYVTPVASDLVGVAILAHGDALRFDDALARFPTLAARLRDVEIASRLRGAGPLYHRIRRRYDGHVALVGDAAGYVDALTGEGLTTGFRCALAIADVIARGQPLAAYEDRYREITRTYYMSTRAMLAVARRPRLRRAVVGLLARAPKVFAVVLAKHAKDTAFA